ncbi:Helicase conserved C-terminal domain [Popillia japonica]|uniref:Helicase conserved C-terminal domain n=1 Tax=Popillia japonica TaxID=7064 RepID=A0AAW1LC89_POPJA
MPLYGQDFREVVRIDGVLKKFTWNNGHVHCRNVQHEKAFHETTSCLMELVSRPADIIDDLREVFNRFIVYVPSVHAPEPELQVWNPPPSTYWGRKEEKQVFVKNLLEPTTILHPIASAMVTQFPDPRLIQYDCGKLQTLDKLLRKLKCEGHRVLIFTQMTKMLDVLEAFLNFHGHIYLRLDGTTKVFTQMTKMLDVLEAFLNFHGHIYLRLDGTTKVDQRQILMERFNGDKRLFAFILSTRSGGIGVNLTGADTVIFYDSDWNPTMDAQAQDRCHRIGQTRDVHIYRLIMRKQSRNQKRLLGDLAIEGGNFTTAYFKSSTIQDLFNIDANEENAASRMSEVIECSNERERQLTTEGVAAPVSPDDKAAMGALENALAACEDDQDVQAARTAKAEAVADLAEFDENIPLEEQEKEKEPEISKAEQEVENLIKQLTPIERYAMRFIEETEAAWSAEQLAAAEREIEEKKLEWERNRLAAMKEEEERRARELEEENELLTFSREDATNQVSNKTKKATRDRDPTPTVKRSNKKSVNKLSTATSRAERLNNRRHYSTRKSTSRQQFALNKTKIEDEIEETTNDSKSSMDDLKSEIDHSCEDEKVTNDNQSNFDVDEGSLDSEADSFKTSNHIDHNSPRTRSRGTVAIDLWTLDINPVLPGVKPIKTKSRFTRKDKSEKNSKKIRSDSENEKVDNNKNDKKNKIDNEKDGSKVVKRIKLENEDSKIIEKSPKRTRANVEVQKNLDEGDELLEVNAKEVDQAESDLTCHPTKRKLRKDDKIEVDDNSKKIKKKNGNKDIQLQEDVEKLMNDDENQNEDKILAETLADVIEETDKNGKVGNVSSKTLKVMLSKRDIDKYLHPSDGLPENCTEFENNIGDTHDDLNPKQSDAQQVKNTTTTLVRNSRRLGSSPKTAKKTADLKNATLDGWLLKSPTSNNQTNSSDVDNSVSSINDSNTVEDGKISCESDDRTSNSNCDEMVNESENLIK